MHNLKFFVDAEAIAKEFGELKKQVEEAITQGVKQIASMTHAKTQELASAKLKSTRQLYLDNLQFQEVEKGIWIVSLDESALWIEEGRKCVVYGKNKSHIPKVLTPDGEVKITQLKKGMLVLNKDGEWTKVIEIYDEHLVKSKYEWHKVEVCNFYPNNPKKHKRKNLLSVIGICTKCGYSVSHQKWSNKLLKLRCAKCFLNTDLVQIELGSWSTKSGKNNQKLTLTSDHRVMTQNGWKEAGDLCEKSDSVFLPSWSNCKVCGKPTFMGRPYCYDSIGGICSTVDHNKESLKNNKHPSQIPEYRQKFLENLRKAKKDNYSEMAVQSALTDMGYTVSFYGDSKETDWIREYPVKCKDGNKNRCFFLDFYNPKLNLALEIDGFAFHSYERDAKRDMLIKEQISAHIIRIPAKKVFNKKFKNQTLEPIVKNHSGLITMLPAPWYRIKKLKQSKCSPLNRRWDITVEKGSSFVCSGIVIHNSGDMTEDLLRRNAKIAKDGSRYKAIPFDHGKAPSQTPTSALMFVNQLKAELKARKIPYKKIEYNADGSPRLGRLHTIRDINSPKPSERASHGVFDNLTIYQRKLPSGKVRRDIVTFRVVSSKMKGSKWIHPGIEPKKFMDEALEWAEKIFNEEILPSILDRYSK